MFLTLKEKCIADRKRASQNGDCRMRQFSYRSIVKKMKTLSDSEQMHSYRTAWCHSQCQRWWLCWLVDPFPQTEPCKLLERLVPTKIKQLSQTERQAETGKWKMNEWTICRNMMTVTDISANLRTVLTRWGCRNEIARMKSWGTEYNREIARMKNWGTEYNREIARMKNWGTEYNRAVTLKRTIRGKEKLIHNKREENERDRIKWELFAEDRRQSHKLPLFSSFFCCRLFCVRVLHQESQLGTKSTFLHKVIPTIEL